MAEVWALLSAILLRLKVYGNGFILPVSLDWTLGFLFTAMQQHDLSRDLERTVMFFAVAVVLHNKLIRISVLSALRQ